jgi:hypothetical protein
MESLPSALVDNYQKLSPDVQLEVVAYVESLAAREEASRNKAQLLSLAGCMSREDADEMLRIIEEGCGQVDDNEW